MLLLTPSLLFGSFTIVYCSSLYFLKAGSRDWSSAGSELASALMSSKRYQNDSDVSPSCCSGFGIPFTTLESWSSQLRTLSVRLVFPTNLARGCRLYERRNDLLFGGHGLKPCNRSKRGQRCASPERGQWQEGVGGM